MTRDILYCVFSLIFFSFSNAQLTVIPDSAFEQELIDQEIDSDGMINGTVATADIENLTSLEVLGNTNIRSLVGLQDFQSLETLRLEALGILQVDISALSNLNDFTLGFMSENFLGIDLSANTNLRQLDILYMPGLNSLDVTSLTNLESLRIEDTPITTLDLSTNTALESLFLENELTDVASEPRIDLTELDLSANIALKTVVTYNLLLPSFDVSELSQLETLSIVYNGFTTLDISNNAELRQLFTGVSNPPEFFPNTNNISSLEFCQNPNLENISLFDSGLEVLNLKNGNNALLQNVNIAENPDLQVINVDDAAAATTGDAPYDDWITDDSIQYSDSGMQCNLSVEDITSQDILVVPNPFHSALNIMSKINEPLNIKVYSSLGNLIYENNNLQGAINTSLWQSGLYIVEFNEHNSTRHYIKVFKE